MVRERWVRPAPLRTREQLIDAESRRDYESAALLSIASCDQLALGEEMDFSQHFVLLAQAQVYATLRLAAVTEAAEAERLRQQR